MNQVRAIVRIEGRVQGVWFRQSTKQAAQRLGVFGWVKNNLDGSVSAIFEGEEAAVKSAVEWCQQGPEMARVDNLETDWQEYRGEFTSFRVT